MTNSALLGALTNHWHQMRDQQYFKRNILYSFSDLSLQTFVQTFANKILNDNRLIGVTLKFCLQIVDTTLPYGLTKRKKLADHSCQFP